MLRTASAHHLVSPIFASNLGFNALLRKKKNLEKLQQRQSKWKMINLSRPLEKGRKIRGFSQEMLKLIFWEFHPFSKSCEPRRDKNKISNFRHYQFMQFFWSSRTWRCRPRNVLLISSEDERCLRQQIDISRASLFHRWAFYDRASSTTTRPALASVTFYCSGFYTENLS